MDGVVVAGSRAASVGALLLFLRRVEEEGEDLRGEMEVLDRMDWYGVLLLRRMLRHCRVSPSHPLNRVVVEVAHHLDEHRQEGAACLLEWSCDVVASDGVRR